jgi:uncharacterized protein YndB with AHSA1/START domain
MSSDIARWLAGSDRRIRRDGDGRSAILRRRYDAAVEDVWSACTSRARLRRWFGDVRGELRPGAVLALDVGLGEARTEAGAAPLITAKILSCQPPHALAITWSYDGDPLDPPDTVTLSLAPDGAGTRLEIEHRSGEPGPWAAGVGAGWEAWIYRLDAVLAGTAPDDFHVGLDEANARHAQVGPLWSPLPEATGVLTRGAGAATSSRWRLRFERTLAHPRDRVWTAVTGELGAWYPARLVGPLRAGAEVAFAYPDGTSLDGVIVALEAPALIAFTEQGDEVRIELADAGAGRTRLVFTHDFAAAAWAPGVATGWEGCLSDLELVLAGERPPPRSEAWRAALRAEYARLYGEPPGRTR